MINLYLVTSVSKVEFINHQSNRGTLCCDSGRAEFDMNFTWMYYSRSAPPRHSFRLCDSRKTCLSHQVSKPTLQKQISLLFTYKLFFITLPLRGRAVWFIAIERRSPDSKSIGKIPHFAIVCKLFANKDVASLRNSGAPLMGMKYCQLQAIRWLTDRAA